MRPSRTQGNLGEDKLFGGGESLQEISPGGICSFQAGWTSSGKNTVRKIVDEIRVQYFPSFFQAGFNIFLLKAFFAQGEIKTFRRLQ